MDILQTRYYVFFLVMLVLPAAFSYLAGFDRNVDYVFFLKAISIAFFVTVLYYLVAKNYSRNSKR